MDISGCAVVTGAASGIGAACAKAYARDGARAVALLDINVPALRTVQLEVEELAKSRSGFRAIIYSVDVTSEENIRRTFETIASDLGRIDYVVNCAGIAFKHDKGAAFASTDDWQKVLNINLNGTFFVLRAAARLMLDQDPLRSTIDGRDLQRGSIINIASIMGVVGITQSTAYCASKHGVVGLTKSASEDYAGKGVRINAVCPGYIDTPLRSSSPAVATAMDVAMGRTAMRRLGLAQEIADAVVFLSGGRSTFITGTALLVDGGYTSR